MVALAKAGPTQFQSLPMEPLQHPPSTTQRISCHGRLANLLLQRTVFISVSLNLALRPQKRMPAGIYKGHLQASIRTPQIVNQPNHHTQTFLSKYGCLIIDFLGPTIKLDLLEGQERNIKHWHTHLLLSTSYHRQQPWLGFHSSVPCAQQNSTATWEDNNPTYWVQRMSGFTYVCNKIGYMAVKELAAKFICRIISIGDSLSYVSSRRLRHIQGLHAYHVEISHVLRVCFLCVFGEWVSTVCKKIWQLPFHDRRQQTRWGKGCQPNSGLHLGTKQLKLAKHLSVTLIPRQHSLYNDLVSESHTHTQHVKKPA